MLTLPPPAESQLPQGDWYMKVAPFLEDYAVGMFSMLDPKPHGVHRSLFSQGFSKSAILKWKSRSKQGSVPAVAKIQRDASAGSADILKWWTLVANDVACELFFGEDFNALAGEQVGLTKRSSKGCPQADF